MNHKISWDQHIIFWSSLLTVLVISQKANGILTDSNGLHCTHIQCPAKCPEDSYLKSALQEEDEEFEDYQDEMLGHDPYIEELDNFEEIPPLEELHDAHSPQHLLKERQKREVFFQEDDIEKCCGDQKCVCNKCAEVPKCVEGHVAAEIQEGQGVPGSCCSLFRCIKKQQCQLGLKQSWWTNKCTKCSCFGDSELCMQVCPEEEVLQNCYSEYWQKPKMNGAFWKEGSCTSCSCEQGERRCFTPVCPKLDCKQTIKLEDECCPQCLHDDLDVGQEILLNKEKDLYGENEGEVEYATEATTIETPVVKTNEQEHNSGSAPVGEGTLTNETQTTSPFVLAGETSTVAVSLENTSEKSFDFTTTTAVALSNSTMSSILANAATTVKPEEERYSSIPSNTTTEGPTSIIGNELESSPNPTSSEDYKFAEILEKNFSSTVKNTEEAEQEKEEEEEKVSLTTSTEILEEIATEATTTTDNLPLENSYPTSTASSIGPTKATPRPSATTTPTELLSNIFTDSTTDVGNVFTTTDESDSPVTLSSVSSASAASRTTPSIIFQTYTATSTISSLPETTMISSSKIPQISITYTTNTPIESTSSAIPTTSSTTTENHKASTSSTMYHTPSSSSSPSSFSTSSSTSSSTMHLTSSSTSTTSSPYSISSVFTTTSIPEQSTSKSTTTSPESVRPLFQSYGDFAADDRTSSTQNQMRIMFDEIDYVVMIVLFIGSMLCISLGLIIRHTKNRKKMYSSIPNSETSLSQTSTNTVLTV